MTVETKKCALSDGLYRLDGIDDSLPHTDLASLDELYLLDDARFFLDHSPPMEKAKLRRGG